MPSTLEDIACAVRSSSVLLAPTLAKAQAERVVMPFDPPLQLNAAGLASFGIDLEIFSSSARELASFRAATASGRSSRR